MNASQGYVVNINQSHPQDTRMFRRNGRGGGFQQGNRRMNLGGNRNQAYGAGMQPMPGAYPAMVPFAAPYGAPQPVYGMPMQPYGY